MNFLQVFLVSLLIIIGAIAKMVSIGIVEFEYCVPFFQLVPILLSCNYK
jgi:hypothetical protein